VDEPFFIVGFQRSGTTLLRLMLDNHPDVAIPLDVTGLWSRYEERVGEFDLNSPAGLEQLIAQILTEERIKLWEVPLSVDEVVSRIERPEYPGVIDGFYRAYAAAKGKKRWGDKDPGNIVRIHQLHRWFPAGRIVHIIRDGRGACLSHLGQDFGFDDVLECASAWREQGWWVRKMGEILGPSRYIEVRYEDLVRDPEAHLRRISEFLELAYSSTMLDYHEHVPNSIPDGKRHIWPLIGEPPNADNAEKWRTSLSPADDICFSKRAGDLLTELGYDTAERPWRGAYATELRHLLARGYRALRGRIKVQRRPKSA
jgi:hypothetical protein